MNNLIEEINEISEGNDLFGTYPKSKCICDFLELDSNKEILTKNNLIAIYGRWGSGKSCLMKTICNNINKDKFDVVWFDTWKYEKDDNLAYSLFKYIGKDNFWDKLVEKSDDIVKTSYGIFKSLAKGVEINLGVLSLKPGEALDEAEKQGDLLDNEVSDKKCLWENIKEFEDAFKDIKIKTDKRLIVFLDDLDRCESHNIITLISSIKLLLSINPNIIFVIGIDREAITLALKNTYNNDYNKADEYLEKIFPISFELNNSTQNSNFLKYISEITGLEEESAKLIVYFFEAIHFTNARHIKKVLRKYYFMKNYLMTRGIDLNDNRNVLLVLYIIILNIYYSAEYTYLIRRDKAKIYENFILYNYDRNGGIVQGQYVAYNKRCDMEYQNGEQYDILKFLERFSSYKIIKNEIKCSMYMTKDAIINLDTWLKAFNPDNICNEFISFIINNSYNYKNLFTENEYDDNIVINLIEIINDII